jgi:hypothetical protein
VAGVIIATLRVELAGARYVKEVDEAETTIRFAQEIYDPTGCLVAAHEKFPVDLGHK